jgi:hypothetical protein
MAHHKIHQNAQTVPNNREQQRRKEDYYLSGRSGSDHQWLCLILSPLGSLSQDCGKSSGGGTLWGAGAVCPPCHSRASDPFERVLRRIWLPPVLRPPRLHRTHVQPRRSLAFLLPAPLRSLPKIYPILHRQLRIAGLLQPRNNRPQHLLHEILQHLPLHLQQHARKPQRNDPTSLPPLVSKTNQHHYNERPGGVSEA